MSDPGLNHREIKELLGAYALNAVDDRERAGVEVHLETCRSCQAEMDDHRRLADNLRRNAVRVSPLASFEADGIHRATGPPAPPVATSLRWLPALALAIVVVMLTGVFLEAQVRFDRIDAATKRSDLVGGAVLATAGPGATSTELRTPSAASVLTILSRVSGGTGYAIDSSLPTLDGDRTYELWSVDHGSLTARVSLGRNPDIAVFTAPGGVTSYVVTVEHTSHPGQPTMPAVATGTVPSSQ
ncbi:MAG TPA: anti-sigma factor [Acidimicrobiales bacterium]|jgi:hypothetical protein|nr:anti-sigma factor [Acidimicrobiales bacterium]